MRHWSLNGGPGAHVSALAQVEPGRTPSNVYLETSNPLAAHELYTICTFALEMQAKG